jgi:hypothetical protein
MERTYVPGVCNLGDAEASRRNTAGWLGLIIAVLLEAYFLYANTLPAIRLVIFIPVTIGAMGFLQGLMHFCVSFGMSGVFNMGPEVGKTDTVAQAEYRAQDKAKAKKIIGYSVAIGVIVALAAYLIL